MSHNSDLARYLLYKNPWEYSSEFEGSHVCTVGVPVLWNPTALANAAVPAFLEASRDTAAPAVFTSPCAGQTLEHLTSIKLATDVREAEGWREGRRVGE